MRRGLPLLLGFALLGLAFLLPPAAAEATPTVLAPPRGEILSVEPMKPVEVVVTPVQHATITFHLDEPEDAQADVWSITAVAFRSTGSSLRLDSPLGTNTTWHFFTLIRAEPGETSLDLLQATEERFEAKAPSPGTYALRIRSLVESPATVEAGPVDEASIPVEEPVPEGVSDGDWEEYYLVIGPDRTLTLYRVGFLAAAEAATTSSFGTTARPSSRGPLRVGANALEKRLVDPANLVWVLGVGLFFLLLVWGVSGHAWMIGPLFSRFDRDGVLENERRSRMYDLIRDHPGVTFQELRQAGELGAGATQHHLHLLEQHGLVRRQRDGRHTRFYPTGPKIEAPTGLTPARIRILHVLEREPGLTATVLAARLDQRVQSTWEQLASLRVHGWVAGERRGRATLWRVCRAPPTASS